MAKWYIKYKTGAKTKVLGPYNTYEDAMAAKKMGNEADDIELGDPFEESNGYLRKIPCPAAKKALLATEVITWSDGTERDVK